MTWEIGLGVAMLAVSAVGVGMQYSASQDAAASQAAMAKYNYAIQEQNIKQQQAIAQQQANYQSSYQQAQAEIARQTAANNAQAYDFQADATLRQGMEASRRTREDQLRFQALQRAGIAKSGVASGAGTPIELLAQSAVLSRLAINDDWYDATNQFNSLKRASALERWGGEFDAAGFGTQAALARYEGSLSPIKARSQMREAEYGRLAGMTGAANTRSAANAGLVSGFGTVLSMGYTTGKDAGWFKTKSPTG